MNTYILHVYFLVNWVCALSRYLDCWAEIENSPKKRHSPKNQIVRNAFISKFSSTCRFPSIWSWKRSIGSPHIKTVSSTNYNILWTHKDSASNHEHYLKFLTKKNNEKWRKEFCEGSLKWQNREGEWIMKTPSYFPRRLKGNEFVTVLKNYDSNFWGNFWDGSNRWRNI